MRIVICLQIPTIFWIDGRTASVSYWMYVGKVKIYVHKLASATVNLSIVLGSTKSSILFALRNVCQSSERNLLLYPFMKSVRLTSNYWRIARTSFGGEVKPLVPCRRFTACERTLQNMNEVLCWQNFWTPVSHLCFSCFTTRWLCVVVGYGTVLKTLPVM
jgi:hypothetical protein